MRILFSLVTIMLITPFLNESPDRAGTSSKGMQESKPLFTFGVIADVQYCDCDPKGTRFYRNSLDKLRGAVSSLKEQDPLFVVNLGDLIEKGFESYKPVMNILDSSGLKIYNLTGNHDYAVEARQKKRIPPLVSSKTGYYSFTVDKFRFIALNGNEISTYSQEKEKIIREANALIEKLKTEGEPNAMDWNGGISAEQLSWLTGQLDESVNKNEKVFILCHFPAWPVNMHNILNYREVLSVLGKYNNIIAWLNGHNHSGNYGNQNMTHFVTLKGMVESADMNSFSLVEVYRNKIWIKGEGREKSQILAY